MGESFKTVSAAGSSGSNGAEVRINMGAVEHRYEDLYEDKVNPFADFSQRERKKRYKSLNAAEKITLNATNFFLANKYTRSFVFFYALTLHLLVFFALYFNAHMSYKSSCITQPHATRQHQQLLMDPNFAAAVGNNNNSN